MHVYIIYTHPWFTGSADWMLLGELKVRGIKAGGSFFEAFFLTTILGIRTICPVAVLQFM